MTRKRVKELGLGEKEEAKYVARLSREIDSSNNPGNVATGGFTLCSIRTFTDVSFVQVVLRIIQIYDDMMQHSLATKRRMSGLSHSIPFRVLCIQTAILACTPIWLICWYHFIIYSRKGVGHVLREILLTGR